MPVTRRPAVPLRPGVIALVLSAVVAAVVAGVAQPAAAASTPSRATWVWGRPAPGPLVTWATKQRVGELFVAVPRSLSTSTDLGWVRDVSRRAHRAGMRVAALGSATEWIDRPAEAVAWQRDALATGLFDGVHLDVEPWLHPAWDSDRAGVVAGYLRLLDELGSATTSPLEVDVAFWLHTVPTAEGVALDAAVARRVDGLTAMTYRDTVTGPDSITDLGGQVLATAAAAGKPCRLAVETRFLGTDPVSQKQTFWGQGSAALAAALAGVDAALAGQPAYAGTAVHDEAGWRAL
ncbi:hypothetical protein [Marmoricola sp. Leaf446]|uniref:hypothetical protein n=1 Tax=Marmoricola sp. Leaf446 TaxID=1736379 RepID=UPI0012E34B3A|nr:hypothetical protein [Marmoricola sp. Leaf446]